MTKLEKIENICCKIIEIYYEVPDTLVLGTSAYKELLKEISSLPNWTRGLVLNTTCGPLNVSLSPNAHPDYLAVGTITLETINLMETVDRLGLLTKNTFISTLIT